MAKVLVNFQDDFLQEIDKVAELEHRTRSSLIREALRRYIMQYKSTEETKQNIIEKNNNVISTNKLIYSAAKAS